MATTGETAASHPTKYISPSEWESIMYPYGHPEAEEITSVNRWYAHDRDITRLGTTVSAFVGGATLAAAGTTWGSKMGSSLKFSFLFNMVSLTYFSRLWSSTQPIGKRSEFERWLPWLSGLIAQGLLVFSVTKSLATDFIEKHSPRKNEIDEPRKPSPLRRWVASKLSPGWTGIVLCAVVFVPAAWGLNKDHKIERNHLKKMIEESNEKLRLKQKVK